MTRIFFLNPDPKIIALYQPVLQQYFTVDSANDGLTGLRKIRLHQPRLVISDYHLPRLSGLALLKYIRATPTLHAIPFLFLTDHDDPADALSFGANDWIPRLDTQPSFLIDRIFHHLKTYGI